MTSADVTGRLVGKRFAVDVFRRLMDEGVPLSSCVLGWDMDQWPGPVQAYTGHHTGWHDVRLVPDLDTLRPAAWLEATAICVADFVEMGRDDLVEVAPRTILRRQVERFSERPGSSPWSRANSSSPSTAAPTTTPGPNGYETLGPDHARARRLHGAGRRPARGRSSREPARGARRLEPGSLDQPGGVGARPVGDQPGVPTGARDGRPPHPVQARDARPRGRERHGRDVHGEAVRRHHRLVMSSAPIPAGCRRSARVRSRSRPGTTLAAAAACGGRRGARSGVRTDALVRAHDQLLPPRPRGRVLRQRAQLGVSTAAWSRAGY